MLFLKHWGGERSKSFEIKSEEQHLVYVHPALNDLSSFFKKKKTYPTNGSNFQLQSASKDPHRKRVSLLKEGGNKKLQLN